MSVFEGKLKKAQVKGKQRGLQASQPKGRKEGRQKERNENKHVGIQQKSQHHYNDSFHIHVLLQLPQGTWEDCKVAQII